MSEAFDLDAYLAAHRLRRTADADARDASGDPRPAAGGDPLRKPRSVPSAAGSARSRFAAGEARRPAPWRLLLRAERFVRRALRGARLFRHAALRTRALDGAAGPPARCAHASLFSGRPCRGSPTSPMSASAGICSPGRSGWSATSNSRRRRASFVSIGNDPYLSFFRLSCRRAGRTSTRSRSSRSSPIDYEVGELVHLDQSQLRASTPISSPSV